MPPEEICLTQEWVLRERSWDGQEPLSYFRLSLPNFLPSSLPLETVLTDSVLIVNTSLMPAYRTKRKSLSHALCLSSSLWLLVSCGL